MTTSISTLNKITETKGTAWMWWLATLVTYGLTVLSRIPLDASYAASQFPVPFYQGQTTFDAEVLNTYYQYMLEAGTLGIYWETQFIDFGFIAANIVNLFCAGMACYKSLPESWSQKRFASTVKYSIVLLPLAPIFDALENLVSFVLLNQIGDLSQSLTVLYSSFASIKFALFVTSYLWVIAVVVILLVNKSLSLFNRR